LNGAQHPQAVVAEGPRVDGAQHTAVQIGAAADRIDVFLRQRIPGDSVDGEVAAPRGLIDRHRRVAMHIEALVAAPLLGLTPRQRDVDPGNLVDGKALPNGADVAEGREQLGKPILRDAEDLEVDVLRRVAAQPIAHPAADDERAAALVADGRRNRARALDGHALIVGGDGAWLRLLAARSQKPGARS